MTDASVFVAFVESKLMLQHLTLPIEAQKGSSFLWFRICPVPWALGNSIKPAFPNSSAVRQYATVHAGLEKAMSKLTETPEGGTAKGYKPAALPAWACKL